MSTNGIIARSTGEGTFEGVYHHWDSYPNEGLGQFLIRILTGHFQNDLARMLCFLVDEHPAGWSTIVNKDFALKPGYTAESLRHPSSSGTSDEDYHAAMEQFRALPDYRRPQCYCHGKRYEEPQVLTEKSDVCASWAYVFDEQERILHVYNREKHRDTKAYFWNDIARIELDDVNQVNWTHIECGENFEHCCHYAWKHFPALADKSNLSMQTFLGLPVYIRSSTEGAVFAPGSGGTKTPLIESGFRDCGTIGARHCSLSSRRLSSMRLSADLSSLPRLAR